jgi:acyl-homoserine-lactone acylase
VSASQNSVVTSSRLAGTGSVSINNAVVGDVSYVESLYDVTFDVDAPMHYRLNGTLNRGLFSGNVSITLSGATTIFQKVADHAAVEFEYSGLLEPGTYRLVAVASAGGFVQHLPAISYQFEMGPEPFPLGEYDADIRWTSYGIPHIKANDYGSAAYGYGYAFARDNICLMAEEFNKVNGERSQYFGPDNSYNYRANGSGNVQNLHSDFFYKLVMDEAFLANWLNFSRRDIRRGIKGWADGYNRYLHDTGLANLPVECRNKPWVRPITSLDMMKRFYSLILLASQGYVIEGMVGAVPPIGGVANPVSSAQVTQALTEERCALPSPGCLGIGSNAYAFGSDATGTSAGMLLGNPHFPWLGTERFHTFQMTIPGQTNVYGMALYGVPLALIGFNEGVAWSHTVSTAYRFTPVELKLAPGIPTSYLIDGQIEAMTTREVEVCVAKNNDGECTDLRAHTFYYSRYGPIFLLSVSGAPVFAWDNVRAYSIRDANAANTRSLDHFFDVNRAQSTAEVKQILQSRVAIPWVNTIAADSTGHALYADISVVPNVPNSLATTCNTVPVGVAVYQLVGLPVLDGSRTSCEWVNGGAPQPGIIPSSQLPIVERTDYTMNSNDSYWLPNHKVTLEGFARIIGCERCERSLRQRLGYRQVIDRLWTLFASDGPLPDGMGSGPGEDKITLEKLQAMLYGNSTYPALGNRNVTAELVRDDLVELCRTPTPSGVASDDGATIDLTQACNVLEAWDLRHNLDSVGAHLFQEFWQRVNLDTVWLTPFDANDPVDTPRGLNTADPQVKQALVDAVDRLQTLNLPLDAPLGTVQYVVRNGQQIPIHGGPGGVGAFNAINNSLSNTPGRGYDVPHGSSYIQTVTWDGNGPKAAIMLTYSQSTDPASPHYKDLTELYSQKGWVTVPYREADILADPNLETLHLVPEPTDLRLFWALSAALLVSLSHRRRRPLS